MLSGSPGTGKTIFGLEYIYNGATKFNEKGIYVSFEQPVAELRKQAKLFGWDFDELIKKGVAELIYIPAKDINRKTSEMILEKVRKGKIKRLVIDSISTLVVNAPIYGYMTDLTLIDIDKGKSFLSPPIIGDFIVKRFVYSFVNDLHEVDGCTTILISEASEKGEFLSRDTISEFICDGVIQVIYEPMGGEFSRSLIVRKMRHTKNDEDIHPLEISPKGIVIHKLS